MAFELLLLGALIFVFIVSFCGLLQKIKQTYDRERLLAARLAQRRELSRTQLRSNSLPEVYINPSFISDLHSDVSPASRPPPYSQYYVEPPPKYEDVVKVHELRAESETVNGPSLIPSAPPPYTIIVGTGNESTNHM